MAGSNWYGFKIPNLPRVQYEYLKLVRDSQQLSPWQVVILALKALEYLAKNHGEVALRLAEDVKREHPKPQ